MNFGFRIQKKHFQSINQKIFIKVDISEFIDFIRINGCYEALEGGNSTDALVDLTGSILLEYQKTFFNKQIKLLH